MTSVLAQSAVDQSQPQWKRNAVRAVLLAPLCVWGVAQLSWGATQARVLWGQPHYQFFPLVLLGALLLSARNSLGLGQLSPGSRSLTIGLFAANAFLLILADRIYSPMVATIGILIGLLALASCFGGAKLVTAVLPAWIFLWVLVRPPMGVDTEVIFRLQSLATRWSSPILDLFGIDHMTAGHVIEIAGRRLLIEEACSGIQSLFVVLACTTFYAFWGRSSWLRLIFLLPIAAIWVLLGNVARIIIVAAVEARFGIDLGRGWRHEVLGFVILVIVIGLVASTDRLLRFGSAVLGWCARRLARRYDRKGRRIKSKRSSGRKPEREATEAELSAKSEAVLATSAPQAQAANATTRLPGWRQTCLGSSWLVVALGLAGAISLLLGRASLSFAAPSVERPFAGLKADDMPAEAGPFRRESFSAVHAGPRYGKGEYLRKWVYRSPGTVATVAVGYPFVGWHELTDCYQAEGWTIDSRSLESDPLGGVISVRMSKPVDKSGLVFFSFDNARGEPLDPPSYRGWKAELAERLRLGWWRSIDNVRGSHDATSSYQVQILLEPSPSQNDVDEAQARGLFRQARERLREIARRKGAP